MRGIAWSVAIMTLASGCSSVNPHYDPTATMVSSSMTGAPALAQAPSARPTMSAIETTITSQTLSPSQTVSPWREDGTRVYSAAKPPVTSLNEAMARSKAEQQPGPTGGTATQVVMRPIAGPASPAPVASPHSPALVASPYSTYAPAPIQPIASRAPLAPSVTDAVAAHAIQQTAASVPAPPTEAKSNNQQGEKIRITSVFQGAGATSAPEPKAADPAAQAIVQTASVPATPPEPKSSSQSPERIRITSVVQDAGDASVRK